jgi:hypothetical protein
MKISLNSTLNGKPTWPKEEAETTCLTSYYNQIFVVLPSDSYLIF